VLHRAVGPSALLAAWLLLYRRRLHRRPALGASEGLSVTTHVAYRASARGLAPQGFRFPFLR